MLAQEHPTSRLSDYVLDLLTPEERSRVDRHLRECDDCRIIVRQERTLTRDVQATILAATEPSPADLRTLSPLRPQRRSRRSMEVLLRPALAFTILLLIFAGSLQLYTAGTINIAAPATPTDLAATATLTPTSTVEPASPAKEAVETQVLNDPPVEPARTPVAMILTLTHN